MRYDCRYFGTELGAGEGGMGDTEGDGHYFDGEDADLVVWI